MNRRFMLLLSVLTASVAVAAPAWGESILSLAGETSFSLPYTGPAFDISAEGNLDWIVVNKNQKNATDIIATYLDANILIQANQMFVYADNGVPDYPPAFAYTGGRNNTSATYERADYLFDYCSTTLQLPAGSGTFSLWWTWGQTNPGNANFYLNFDDGASYASPDGFNYLDPRKTVINWQTDTPQTLHFSSNVPAGLWAMAVSQVPEPGTLTLLGFIFLGLVVYAWRKTRGP
jgi:hypothetical protein